jgi:hypothetical protein
MVTWKLHARYNHHGAYRTFQKHEGWIEAMIAVYIPAVYDNTGKASAAGDACAAAVPANKAAVPSLRQQWLQWTENRKRIQQEGGTPGSMHWTIPRGVSFMCTKRCAVEEKSPVQPKDTAVEPEETPLMQRRKTLMSQVGKEDLGEKLFTEQAGTLRLTKYRSELPGSKLKAELDRVKAELQQEAATEVADKTKRESVADTQEQQNMQDREGKMNEYLFTACATGVVHQWALDDQIQCDKFEVRV